MNHKLRIWFNILDCIIGFVTHGQWHQVWQRSEWCLQEQQCLIVFLMATRSRLYALRSPRHVIAVQPACCKASAGFQKHLQRAVLPNFHRLFLTVARISKWDTLKILHVCYIVYTELQTTVKMLFIPLSLLLSVLSGEEAALVRDLLPFAAASWPMSLPARLVSIPTRFNMSCGWLELQGWPNGSASDLCCTPRNDCTSSKALGIRASQSKNFF